MRHAQGRAQPTDHIFCHSPILSALRSLRAEGQLDLSEPTKLPGHPTEGTTASNPKSNGSVR
jgi:hypothetical protein